MNHWIDALSASFAAVQVCVCVCVCVTVTVWAKVTCCYELACTILTEVSSVVVHPKLHIIGYQMATECGRYAT